MDNVTGKFKGFAMFVYKTIEGCKKALEEPNKVFDGCQLQCRQAVDGQRGNKSNKKMQSGTSNAPGNVQQSEIGNLGYGYGGVYAPQLMNPGIMVGQNPMLVSALSQNSITPGPQSFGLSGGYGLNTVSPNMIASYGSQLGLAGLGAYQNNSSQVGRSSGGTTPVLPARQQSGLGSLGTNFPSYLGR
ncbi:hypothetical protein L1887_09055 [Cichorium endivia]|nr:hypothetical protein L1887_09055 [Cichorium endivia]